MLVRVLAAIGAAALLPRHANGNSLQRDVEPCQQIRDFVNKWFKDNNIVPRELTIEEQNTVPKVPAVPIKPSLAYACLKSVPLNKTAALGQLDYLRPFYEWQSSLDLLKDPPSSYLSQRVNILGGLDDIAKKLNWNLYPNTFDFLVDLYTLTTVRPRDAHLRYNTLIFDLFSFEWSVRLVSVSKDGRELPELFLYEDNKARSNRYTPSPVIRIDGINAQDYVEKRSAWNRGSHDPDARYNTLFPSLSKDTHFSQPPAYDAFHLDLPDTTKVELQNGTKLEFQNHALVRANFSEISSGTDLYKVYAHPDGKGESPMMQDFYWAAERNFTHQYTGYPKALDMTQGRGMAAFLPDEDGLNDTAVLSLSAFSATGHPRDPVIPTSANMVADYTRVMHNLIREANATGRTKLIIDLQSNAGGFLTNLAVIYFSLFPDTNSIIPVLWELRAHPQLKWLGTELERAGRLFEDFSLPQNWLTEYTQPNGTAWPDFSSLYGPLTHRGGVNVTHTALINMPALFANSSANYTAPTWTTPPFSPENIMLLNNGECASSCAIFTTIMTIHHGIRSVAIGGRPLTAPMQSIGQVNGGPGQSAALWSNYARGLNLSTLPSGTRFFNESNPPMRVLSWIFPGDGMALNWGNIYPLKEEEGTPEWERGTVPVQFRYKAANCRLFYTWDGVKKMSSLWGMVRDVAWGGGRCVKGSTTDPQDKMGKGTKELDKDVVGDRWGIGAGVGAG